jgi:hypothetical protein
MYNALWASRNAKIIEIMPVSENGQYIGQAHISRTPPYAHLAIYTNSVLNEQTFYRWYEVTDVINYHVTLSRFRKWLRTID